LPHCNWNEAKVCPRRNDIDIGEVNSPSPRSERPELPQVPKNMLRLMLVILIVLALVSLYANVERWHRSHIETVTFTPAQTASPSPATP
jgi:hypothetical protein